MYFTQNVTSEEKNKLKLILAMKECTHDEKYINAPFCKVKKKSKAFKKVREKVRAKLNGWRMSGGIRTKKLETEKQ